MKKAIAIFFFFLLIRPVITYANFYHRKIVTDTIPSIFKGNFIDDYKIRYTISDTLWIQHPDVKYHIISCNTESKYFLVRNDDDNPSEVGLFTRIDYMNFTNMEPFHWGFCLTIYNAKSIEEAKEKASADRQNPKQGCGGYPFTRMKNID